MGHHLGGGAFGDVFAALLTLPSGKQAAVAVKRMLQGVSDESAFEAEASAHALASLSRHKNVARLLGVTSSPSALVMERARWSLRQALAAQRDKGDRLPLKAVLRVFRGLVDACEHLHSLELVHRDLSSGNVLVDSAWNAKIIDFGLCRANGAASSASSGAAAWAAPEIFLADSSTDDRTVSRSADVFALGVLLWELLSCEMPWAGLSALQIIARVCVEKEGLPWPLRSNAAPRGARGRLAQLSSDMRRRVAEERPSLEDVGRALSEVVGGAVERRQAKALSASTLCVAA